jgi:hypothetical protein
MVMPEHTAAAIGADPGSREQELPRHTGGCPGILALERVRQPHLTEAAADVVRMERLHAADLRPQPGLQRPRQQRSPLVAALPVTNDDLARTKVEVLDTKTQRFGDTKPRARPPASACR